MLNILRYVLVGMIGVTLLLGVLSHKMIAAEKLTLFAVIYFTYILLPKKTETLSVVEYFSLFSLNVPYLDNYKMNLRFQNCLSFYSNDNR